ncbi:LuxR C-terminal-related transcriptional regulator [Aquibacillus koreensis]|uniref:LuxR C-terminal-related transcriptional regulator n=1 Tax=Aquibacillus koreensis TaxID=279446 RepID=A0A9X4AKC0_9BACI|nr:LuxR C-terminal-related transcriptional regulator [Aquibacillus koreensis]MCT2537728.1 LuxR C-terminal-related transcriptional regulator [Aquibacillus koreensis]MDC3421238.1 LuxR C-terminal-related transcriptional regulator [Aquibacillus koreensis]
MEKYDLLRQRCVSYYQSKVGRTHAESDIAEFFYHLGDEFIQSIFFQDTVDDDLYLDHVGKHNFSDIEAYFTLRKKMLAADKVDFFHRETNSTYQYNVSLQHNEIESKLVDAEYIKRMGYRVARILRNKNDEMLGLSIVVPINEDTITQLAKEPVSSCYFQQLSKEMYREFSVPSETNAGWFIRMLDCLDANDTFARSFLLYNLSPLLLSGGRIITSTPLPFFQEVLKSFGFTEVPGATHYDFGTDQPSPTYILDVRGQRLSHYLDQFTNSNDASERLEVILNAYPFTVREKEVVKLILEEYSNIQIAEQLYVAEITVKKHVGRILKKVDVKNRTQLIKRLMESF